jgi:hypothetical protein
MRPVKYTPAQNKSAYAALKFGGMSPGIRVSANTTINRMGSSFVFTAGQHKKNGPENKHLAPAKSEPAVFRCLGRGRRRSFAPWRGPESGARAT